VSALVVGVVCGLGFGAIAAALMLPLQFPDKRAALTGAFLNRFAIGVAIGAAMGSPQINALRIPAWCTGLLLGVILSAADAVITKAYAPIIAVGAIGGAAIGWIVAR
jgi:hypothetical protein